MNVLKDAKKSMKKMKNTDEEYECMQREYVGKNFQVKSESEKMVPYLYAKLLRAKWSWPFKFSHIG